MDHLQEVFERLIRNNLKLKTSKCPFFKSQIEYLGFTIDANGLQPQKSKIEAINRMPAPVNCQEIQVFLGMMGYYWRFIPNFATQAGPLFALLRKDFEFF